MGVILLETGDTLLLEDANALLLESNDRDPFPITLTLRDYGHTATIREQH